MAANRVTSIAAEVLATPVSQARVSTVAAEVLATASSKARISSIALEALVSNAEVPAVPAPSRAIVMILGGWRHGQPGPEHLAGLLQYTPAPMEAGHHLGRTQCDSSGASRPRPERGRQATHAGRAGCITHQHPCREVHRQLDNPSVG
jgi:hypothetical protein